MRYYSTSKQYVCGVDLHAKNIYVCIINKDKHILLHRKFFNKYTDLFLKILEPYQNDIVVACESTYAWYWLADLCSENNIEFILGHALYMKAIHGSKVKNDKIDSKKIALLVHAGLFPLAYVYPHKHRSIRDLLRRRLFFARARADLLCHIQLLNAQVNLPPMGRLAKSPVKRNALAGRFGDPSLEKSLAINNKLVDFYDSVLKDLEQYILTYALKFNRKYLSILQSIKGVGDIIALTIIYEVDDINRFATPGQFASYSRVVKCKHESSGKLVKSKNTSKIGNAYLKYIFAEAAFYTVKYNENINKYFTKLQSRKGTGKAYAVISHKIAKTVYYMLKNGTVFDEKRFLTH